MSKKCPLCEKQSFTPFAMGSSVYMDVYKCNVCGAECMVTQLEDIILFDRITQSPEVLAEKLVYRCNCKMIYKNDICTLEYWTLSWKSSVISGQSFETKEEAIAATVAKLKEVAVDA